MSQQFEALEARVAALESRLDRSPVAQGDAIQQSPVLHVDADAQAPSEAGGGGPFFLLEALEERQPGTVAVVGAIDVAEGPVRWQYSQHQRDLEDAPWGERAEAFAALGNASRLAVLQAVLPGARRVSELVDELGFDSLGQLNHHIRVLTSAGWLEPVSRGFVRVPPARAIPLLAAVVAAG